MFDPIDTQMCLSSVEKLSHGSSDHDFAYIFKRAVRGSPPLGTFRPRHFQLVVCYLGMGSFLQQPDESILSEVGLAHEPAEWLSSMFHACQTPQILRSMPVPPSDSVLAAAALNQETLMFWALWETARFCVLSRLRTPLGGPLQTLEAVEHALQYYLELIRDSESAKLRPDQFFAVMQRLRHLIEFADMLEIQIFNASRGNFSLLPSVPKASMVFLHANRRVCDEWFSRIRLLITNLSEYVELDGSAIHHGYEALHDHLTLLNKKAIKDVSVWQKDCLSLLLWLSRALSRSKDVDGLVGLARFWRRETVDVRANLPAASDNIYRWLCVQAVLSEGQFEIAARELNALSAKFTAAEKEILANAKLNDQLLECYTKLGDWSSARDLLEAVAPDADTLAVQRQFQLGYCQASSVLTDFDPKPAIARDFLDLGPTKLALKISVRGFVDCMTGSAGAKNSTSHDHDGPSNSTEHLFPVFRLLFNNNRDRLVSLFVLSQQHVHIANSADRALDTATGVRIGQARAKDHIRPETIVAKHLSEWMQLLTIFKETENQHPSLRRDPDLDEIRGLLANLSRKVRNLQLANRLLDSSQSNLTSSAALKNNFKFARLLFEEGRARDAFVQLLSVINTHSAILDQSDLEIKAKACRLISEWNRPMQMDLGDAVIRRHLEAIVAPLPRQVSEDWLSFHMLKRGTEISPHF
eukprot:jgi/Hompol1/6953/HPOL_002394-RA